VKLLDRFRFLLHPQTLNNVTMRVQNLKVNKFSKTTVYCWFLTFKIIPDWMARPAGSPDSGGDAASSPPLVDAEPQPTSQ
jgi:hypothetical protein